MGTVRVLSSSPVSLFEVFSSPSKTERRMVIVCSFKFTSLSTLNAKSSPARAQCRPPVQTTRDSTVSSRHSRNRLFWRNPFSPEGRNNVEKILPIAGEIRQSAEDAFTVFASSQKEARHHGDTFPYLEFAALKLDALGMRYQYVSDISRDYSTARSRNNGRAFCNRRRIDSGPLMP